MSKARQGIVDVKIQKLLKTDQEPFKYCNYSSREAIRKEWIEHGKYEICCLRGDSVRQGLGGVVRRAWAG